VNILVMSSEAVAKRGNVGVGKKPPQKNPNGGKG